MPMKLWKLPDSYFGASWDNYYVFLGRNRDSGCLGNSNFECGLKAIRSVMSKKDIPADDEEEYSKDEGATVQVVHEGHWACGWVEWIAIHKSDTAAIAEANEIIDCLEDYLVLNDEDLSNREYEEFLSGWSSYGAHDFRQAVLKGFEMTDEQEELLDAVEDEKLRDFYQERASEPYFSEDSGVCIPTDRMVERMKDTDFDDLMKMCRGESLTENPSQSKMEFNESI